MGATTAEIDRAELKNKLEEAAKKGSVDLNEVLKDFLPKIDPERVKAVRESMISGQEVNLKELKQVLLNGNTEERLALREACASPRACAANQDLNLPKLTLALKGDLTAKKFYENHRVIIPEALADWAFEFWQRETSATWRIFDPKNTPLWQYRKQIGIELKPTNVAPFNPEERPADDAKLKWSDERGSFLTYAIGLNYVLKLQQAAANNTAFKKQAGVFFVLELRENFKFLGSSSYFGHHYRSVAERETRTLFGAQLIEDASIALNFPFSAKTKTAILEKIVNNPWLLLGQLKLHRYVEPVSILRAEGKDENFISSALDRFLFTPGALSAFYSERQTKVAAAKPKEPHEQRGNTAQLEAVTSHRKSELRKALERSPYRTAIDVDRKLRLIGKYVYDSEQMFQLVLRFIADGRHPDNIVPELQVRRSHSSFKPDVVEEERQPEQTSDSGPTGETKPPAAQVEQETKAFSKRLIFRAALESSYRLAPEELTRLSRVLVKLTNESDTLFDLALTEIENGQNMEGLISTLRSKRSPAAPAKPEAREEEPMSPQLMQVLGVGIAEPESPGYTFSFTREAEKRLKEGRIRHAVDRALERFSERPELADLRKIEGLDRVWELRLLRENLRVYLTRSGNEVQVLLIGKKDEQELDIARLSR